MSILSSMSSRVQIKSLTSCAHTNSSQLRPWQFCWIEGISMHKICLSWGLKHRIQLDVLSSHSLGGEPWDPLTSLHIVEVVVDESASLKTFKPVGAVSLPTPIGCLSFSLQGPSLCDNSPPYALLQVPLVLNQCVPDSILNCRKVDVHSLRQTFAVTCNIMITNCK